MEGNGGGRCRREGNLEPGNWRLESTGSRGTGWEVGERRSREEERRINEAAVPPSKWWLLWLSGVVLGAHASQPASGKEATYFQRVQGKELLLPTNSEHESSPTSPPPQQEMKPQNSPHTHRRGEAAFSVPCGRCLGKRERERERETDTYTDQLRSFPRIAWCHGREGWRERGREDSFHPRISHCGGGGGGNGGSFPLLIVMQQD